MKTRVITSIVGLAILAAALAFYDTIVFNLIIAFVTLIAIHEIYNAFQFGKKSLYIFLGFVPMALLVMLSEYLPARKWLVPAGYIFTIFIAISVVANCNTINFAKLSGMTVFSAVTIYCFYSLVQLKSVLPSDTYGLDAIYFVVLILAFAWGGDTMAYFSGRAFGKRKLAPIVSPHKTVEGAIGGILGSMVLGVVVTVVYMQLFGSLFPESKLGGMYYVMIALLGAVASALGILGDLFASAIKRQCGIKDYGTIFPGHGGILDRFDSVLFIAPLVSIIIKNLFYYYLVS